MYVTYLYSDEWNQEEKDNLIKKTAWFMEQTNLPEQIIKPHSFVYGEEGRCIGYTYRRPLQELISLKELFQLEKLSEYRIESGILFQIAENVLELTEVLSGNNIYPGFIDLSYLYVPKTELGKSLYLYHPELFQVGSIPSSYPWYPSDGRLFEEEFELFDDRTQKTADAKLIYKILTAASRGNAKIPPNQKTQETSWMYWNLLSREWKDYFSDLGQSETDYDKLRNMIKSSMGKYRVNTVPIELPKENDLESKTEASSPEASTEEEREEQSKDKAYALIIVLRQAEKSLHDISRELYLLQEKIEQHPSLDFAQGLVLGNKHPFTRPFAHYKKEFRSQLGHVISDYSFGEAIIIGCEMMEAVLKKEERPSIVFLLLDGEIKNDKIFHIGLKKLEMLKENWYTKLVLVPVGNLKGEGYQLLNDICMKGN